MSDLPVPLTLSPVVVANMECQSMHIATTVLSSGRNIATQALIDSRAGGVFIDKRFVKRERLEQRKLMEPIKVLNTDGMVNRTGLITHFTQQTLEIGGTTRTINLMVTTLGKENIILGMPWLKQVNPNINWIKGTLDIREMQLKNASTSETQEETPTKTTEDGDKDILLAYLKPEQDNKKPEPPKEVNLDELLPDYCKAYRKVFEKKASERFPKSRQWDHTIDLKPDFMAKDCKLYPLNPMEQEHLDKFLKENLNKGYIRPLKSPMASPFFFISKKDGSPRPIQDY